MNAPPSRRWFRFSLRTVFALITLVCLVTGWIGYELNWIRQRQERFKMNHVYDLTDSVSCDAPGLLWLFGESGYPRLVVFNKRVSAMEREGLQSLFPEAQITYSDDWHSQ